MFTNRVTVETHRLFGLENLIPGPFHPLLWTDDDGDYDNDDDDPSPSPPFPSDLPVKLIATSSTLV